MNKKRQSVTQYLLDKIQSLDPSGTNKTRYKEMFDEMTDAQFDKFMKDLKDKKTQINLYTPNMKIGVKIEDILKVAKDIGLSLFERIKLRDESTGKYYMTNQKYLILQLPVRRTRQFLLHKLSVSESDKRIDSLTGQVVKPDRASALSQVESQILYARGLDKTLVELIKVRGGDINAYTNTKQQLEETGVASLNALEPNTIARSTLITSVLLKGMLLDNNIVE